MKTARILIALSFVIACAASAVFAGAQSPDASVVTLKGQVACSTCWYEHDRAKVAYGTKKDIKCASNCAKGGVAGALAVTDKGATTVYVLEDGKVALLTEGDEWSKYAGQQVEMTGSVRTEGDKHYLKVDSVKVISAAPGA